MSYETLDLAIQALVASNAQLVSSVNEVRVGVEGVAEAAEGSKNAAGVSAQEAADTAAGLTASVNSLLADKLGSIDALIGDVESALIIINGES